MTGSEASKSLRKSPWHFTTVCTWFECSH